MNNYWLPVAYVLALMVVVAILALKLAVPEW
jgi:hypothetical protein